jgi:hypothetical protein
VPVRATRTSRIRAMTGREPRKLVLNMRETINMDKVRYTKNFQLPMNLGKKYISNFIEHF